MLKSIRLKNYRSCIDMSFDFHPNLSVLIGPNGSGKTNVMLGIMLLYKMAADDSPFNIDDECTVFDESSIVADFLEEKKQIRVSAKVNVYANESNQDSVRTKSCDWAIRINGKTTKLTNYPMFLYRSRHEHLRHISKSMLSRMMIDLDLPRIRNVHIENAIRDVMGYCSGFTYYYASQFTDPGRCPVSFEVEKEGALTSSFRARGHTRVLHHIYLESKNRLQQYNEFLSLVDRRGLGLIDRMHFKEIITSETEHKVSSGGRIVKKKRVRKLIIPQFQIGRWTLTPNQLSEGTFKTIALLFYVVTGRGSALLIEEPEVCVHHGLLSSILEIIKIYSREKQMIVSTHSDYVLDRLNPQNVYCVSNSRDKGTVVRPIEKMMPLKDYNALKNYLDNEGNLGEYWRESGFEDRV